MDARHEFAAAPGRVIASGMQEVRETFFPRRGKPVVERTLRPYVSYEYAAPNGRKVGSRIYPLDHPRHARLLVGEREATDLLARHPVGATVTVRHAVAVPNLSYLDPGWHVAGRAALSLAPAFAIWNLLFAVLGGLVWMGGRVSPGARP